MHTAEQLAAGSARLLTLPDLYWRAKRVIDDPKTTHADLAKVILSDPAMTGRVLRLVNSAIFGYRGRIESVSRAIALLGMYQIHDLVLATGVARIFQGIEPSRMDMARFWKGSLHRALCAGGIARSTGLADAQRPFVEGLLSDIGHLVLYQQVPEAAAAAIERAGSDLDALAEIERELIGCDYTAVGAALTTAWGLPECFAVAIGAQDAPSRAGDHTLEAAILHIAARISAYDLAGGEEAEDVRIDPQAPGLAGLTSDQIPEVLAQARDEFAALDRTLADA